MNRPVVRPVPLVPLAGAKQQPHPSVETLIREAHKVMAIMGITIAHNRLHRIIRRYLTEGRADVDFRTWFLTYADPTGERAVRNVLKAQR